MKLSFIQWLARLIYGRPVLDIEAALERDRLRREKEPTLN